MMETFYEVMRRKGISRRSFLKYCSLTATSLGLAPSFVPQIAHAMETKMRTPVIWLHGLECTCCTEAFIRSAHPLAKDVVLSMISLDYDDTLMAAAGHQAGFDDPNYFARWFRRQTGLTPSAWRGPVA
jgi:hydrogenase small subunit